MPKAPNVPNSLSSCAGKRAVLSRSAAVGFSFACE